MRPLLCIMLFLSAVWIGAQRYRDFEKRPRVLFALADSLSVLQNEVCVRCIPLPDALHYCATLFSETKLFYQMLHAGIQTGRPVSDVWRDAALQLDLNSQQARQTLLSLGEQIGRYDAKTQETAFAVSVTTLRDCASRSILMSKTNAKLAIGFGMVCGLLLAVMCY